MVVTTRGEFFGGASDLLHLSHGDPSLLLSKFASQYGYGSCQSAQAKCMRHAEGHCPHSDACA